MIRPQALGEAHSWEEGMGGGSMAPLLASQLVAWEPWVLPCESAPDREPV